MPYSRQNSFSWSRVLQTLMGRYQSAVSTRRLPAVADALSRAETTH